MVGGLWWSVWVVGGGGGGGVRGGGGFAVQVNPHSSYVILLFIKFAQAPGVSFFQLDSDY